MRKLWWGLAAAVGFSACGPGNTFEGKVKGQTLAPKEAVFGQIALDEGTIGFLVVSDQTGICDALKTNKVKPSQTNFFTEFYVADADGKPTAPKTGTFSAVSPLTLFGTPPKSQNVALVFFSKVDSACKADNDQSDYATSGSWVLSGYDPKSGGSAKGSFDLTFSSGDKGKGSFDAKYCDVPASVITEEGSPEPSCS